MIPRSRSRSRADLLGMRTGKLGTPERRCLTMLDVQSGGWTRGPKGHWLSPRRGGGPYPQRRNAILPMLDRQRGGDLPKPNLAAGAEG